MREVREIAGSTVEQLTPIDREWDCGGWVGVPVCEMVRIEWNESPEPVEPPGLVMG